MATASSFFPVSSRSLCFAGCTDGAASPGGARLQGNRALLPRGGRRAAEARTQASCFPVYRYAFFFYKGGECTQMAHAFYSLKTAGVCAFPPGYGAYIHGCLLVGVLWSTGRWMLFAGFCFSAWRRGGEGRVESLSFLWRARRDGCARRARACNVLSAGAHSPAAMKSNTPSKVHR